MLHLGNSISHRIVFFSLFIFLGLSPKSQTVGVTEYTDEVESGFTLFSPLTNSFTYLIDECGQVINEWDIPGVPGMMAKLTDEGNIVKGLRIGSPFFVAGGLAGLLESYDWEGNLIFSYNLNDTSFHSHHDFEILPNGNILVLGWGLVSQEKAISLGRTATHPNGIFTEKIIELLPINESNFEVIWEWDVFDHLIQNINDTLPNFGNPIDYPEKININYTNGSALIIPDWLHCNSLDYNPQLDQIILNSRNFGEFWILDHSTTTEEAKTNEGGNAGMGGDILYRWGNPHAYDAGLPEELMLHGQHDANWVKEGNPGEGNVMIFNNGLGRPDGSYSTIDEVIPPIDGLNYILETDKFGPDSSTIIYGEFDGPQSFFSQRISGSQKLPNGNTLICIGGSGNLIEINENKEVVWRYINPSGNFISSQGDSPQSVSNSIFQVIKYAPDFKGFEDKDVTPGEKIELNPTDNCNLVSFIEDLDVLDINLSYNSHNIYIENNTSEKLELYIYNSQGLFIEKISINGMENKIHPAPKLPSTMYFGVIQKENQFIKQLKFAVINE